MRNSGNYTPKHSSPQSAKAGSPAKGGQTWENKDCGAGMHSGTGTASAGKTHAGMFIRATMILGSVSAMPVVASPVRTLISS